jgi:hypothetical protein
VIVLSGVLAVGLAAVHLLAGRLEVLDRVPRSRWLSFGGGVSVAYVFVHLLPELGEHQEAFEGVAPVAAFVDRHVYLIALVGFGTFYGLERLAHRSRDGGRDGGSTVRPFGEASNPVFWVHVGSFALYDAVIGYLLVRGQSRVESLLLFAVAMALHFLVNDFGLRDHHRDVYDHAGRWILGGSVVVGWLFGLLTAIRTLTVGVLLAFLGGGIILNVIKEELPAERESRFWAFAAGAGGYAALLLAV